MKKKQINKQIVITLQGELCTREQHAKYEDLEELLKQVQQIQTEKLLDSIIFLPQSEVGFRYCDLLRFRTTLIINPNKAVRKPKKKKFSIIAFFRGIFS